MKAMRAPSCACRTRRPMSSTGRSSDEGLTMPSPFPGMDPYIERLEIFPDFHANFITRLQATLQPLLRPRYVALTEDRLYVVESDRPIRPDLSIVRTSGPARPARSGAALLEPDAPVIFEWLPATIRESRLHIAEP